MTRPLQVTVEIKSEAVSFPAVTLCNYRNMDFEVINSINKILTSGSTLSSQPDDGEDYVDPFIPDNPFVMEYMNFMTSLTNIKFSPRYRTDPELRRAIQVNHLLY